MDRLSIPYSSGQCFFSALNIDKNAGIDYLSIPYSSGQCFFSSRHTLFCPGGCEDFQSLIHQVSVSFQQEVKETKSTFLQLSIPYSSGQCFFFFRNVRRIDKFVSTFNPLFIRSVFLFHEIQKPSCPLGVRFQSLIHQVSVSFRERSEYQ